MWWGKEGDGFVESGFVESGFVERVVVKDNIGKNIVLREYDKNVVFT